MKRILLTVLILTSCAKKVEKTTPSAPPVEVATVIEKDLPIYIPGIGHMTSVNSIDIQAQVEGELIEIHFEQGSDVKEGDKLLTIDPRPYEAALARAKAVLAENVANLAFAKDKVARYESLVTNNYVSKLNYDEYVTQAEMYTATIEANEADILTAEINLGYCFIRAPFSGRIGKRLVDKGNLITNDGSTLLTIRQIAPIYCDFSIPEKDLASIKQGMEVQVLVPDRGKEVFTGKLIVIDNTVNQGTGMIGLRAELKNEDYKLWPGQFSKVQVITKTVPNSLLVPVAAINTSQKGKFVYVVDTDGKAVIKKVTLGERVDDLIEITKGLEKGDVVVTDGQLNVLPGKKVKIVKQHKDN